MYEEISENGIEEMISAYKMAVDIFSKSGEVDLSKIEDDEKVEKFAEELMNN